MKNLPQKSLIEIFNPSLVSMLGKYPAEVSASSITANPNLDEDGDDLLGEKLQQEYYEECLAGEEGEND